MNNEYIYLYPSVSMLYWTDWNRDGPRIERSHLDGGNRTVLVDTNIELPNGLSLDYTSSQICWADAGKSNIIYISLPPNPTSLSLYFYHKKETDKRNIKGTCCLGSDELVY